MRILVGCAAAALVLGAGGLAIRGPAPEQPKSPYAVLGAAKVQAQYRAWVRGHEAAGGDRNVEVGLGYVKGLSNPFTSAAGVVHLDLIAGRVSAEISGLPAGEFALWLVDNRPAPGASVLPEASDAQIRVGRLERAGSEARLSAELGPQTFADFETDLVVVAPADGGAEGGILHGSLPLFQHLYTSLRSPALLQVGEFRDVLPRDRHFAVGVALAQSEDLSVAPEVASIAPAEGAELKSDGSLVDAQGLALSPDLQQPESAQSQAAKAHTNNTLVDADVVFNALVATGANLFINETFQGNGRTCATCHPFAANTQLNPLDIAALPDTDKLFVAEFLPALAFDPNGPKFEVPALMRGNALITENQDGFGDLTNKFNMRGIPHTLGLITSLTPVTGNGDLAPFLTFPAQRTGWSGDGAPNAGALRDFATGAVTQHFTKTFNRIPGVDFVLPTEDQLNAMEAFQLALGRPADINLATMSFRNPLVERGRTLFLDPTKRCNACHSNAGANVAAGQNRNFNTGVELQLDRPTEVILVAAGLDLTPGDPNNRVPRDGGFGGTGNPTLNGNGTGSTTVGFGNGTFNTPPLIEAADTAPFFHDNSVSTLESAVAFYTTDAFANSVAGGGNRVNLQAPQIQEVADMLRALNALENIRAAREIAVGISALVPPDRKQLGEPLLLQAIQEVNDAMRVLAEVNLHPGALARLADVLDLIDPPQGNVTNQMATMISLLDQARADIVF